MIFPLLVQPRGGEPSVFAEAFTIGRSGDLAVTDLFATPLHARCWPQGEDWVIADLGSVNGTWVNGVRAFAPAVLAKGDVVKIGRTLITMVPAR